MVTTYSLRTPCVDQGYYYLYLFNTFIIIMFCIFKILKIIDVLPFWLLLKFIERTSNLIFFYSFANVEFKNSIYFDYVIHIWLETIRIVCIICYEFMRY